VAPVAGDQTEKAWYDVRRGENGMSILIKAPAKVNLLLRVTGKRDDGYHDITTFFAAVNLYDKLTFVEDFYGGSLTLTCDHSGVPTDESNLVLKAASALRPRKGVTNGATISLEKKIPVAAGLGGGSSDAAATLIGLNKLWGLGVGMDELLAIAEGVGADAPFFVSRFGAAWGCGVGERLEEATSEKPLHLLLVTPDFGISAADAYRFSTFSFTPFEITDATRTDIATGDPSLVALHMENDLEEYALRKHPDLMNLRSDLDATGPLKVMLSGSGPTLMALYASQEDAEEGAERMKTKAPFVRLVQTLDEGIALL